MSVPSKIIPIKAQGVTPDVPGQIEQSLFAVRQKIYPRAVRGWFARWRWTLVFFTQILFYGLAWLPWNGRQAVLFDLTNRRFYIFDLVLWPQDFIFLTALLIICAYALFLFTAIAGRLWCGYACPQTVYTELFMWIERKIEGDRGMRMKLDNSQASVRKFATKSAKHAVWIALSLWTGFTFVGYFTPIRELAHSVSTLSTGPWETFWILFYGFATYGNAGFMREQVCKYMCPYARFQGSMFDEDTLNITYDERRGEPRGARSRKDDRVARGLGDCIDCGLCVQVCPTGIDIRNGQQYECIGCAACIDACNQVMDKVGYPKGLIRYSTLRAVKEGLPTSQIWPHVFRPRTIIYASILVAIITAFLGSLWLRKPLLVDVIRDRGTLAREVENGAIENVFRLQIMNAREHPMTYRIEVAGLAGAQVASDKTVTIAAASTKMVPTRVRAPATEGHKGSNPIVFNIESMTEPSVHVREKSVFFIP